ncbi:MAG: glycoside hydrolase family 3 C-terminal domain-containing protein [Pseudomonadota bacterium]
MTSELLTVDAARIDALVAELSLAEKVALMSGDSTWTTPALPERGIPAQKLCDGPNAARGDAMRGVAAASFPVGSAMASSWNPGLVERIGTALAEEAKTKGVSVLLGPTINLQRHPLGGRNFECYSEDPLLTGRIACAFIRGVQSQGVAACAKHFVANEAEVERHSISSVVDERSLRELYLRPFEMAVRDADVWTVMSAYNRINGRFASSHEPLLLDLLKREWGFAGYVVSDWGAALETVDNALAGLDLEMPGPPRTRGERLITAVADGTVPAGMIDDCVRRLLRVTARTVGLCEPDALPVSAPERAEDRPEHRALAREAAAAGMVLLRNEHNVLPLPAQGLSSLAVIGPNAHPGQIQGGGSSQVFAHYQVSPLDGLRARVDDVRYALGASNNKYLPVPGQERCWLPDADRNGLALRLFAGPEPAGEPVVSRSLSARVSPWGFIPLGLPGREDSPFDDSGSFSATLEFDYEPEQSAVYDLGLQSAGLARLYVNDRLLIDNWSSQQPGDAFFGHGSTEVRGSYRCEAAERIRIRIEFQSQSNRFIQGVRYGIAPQTASPEALLAQAEATARAADACVLIVGSNSDWETEGNDRADMDLPGRQNELIERVLAANPRTVVVMNSGGAMTMPWFERAPAVLQAWLPGQEFGNALADVLFGDWNPSGRLAQTFPRSRADSPADPFFHNADGEMHYSEALSMGYRGFAESNRQPLAPFGFGLSYTTFELTDPQIELDPQSRGARIAVTLENTGQRSGRETVQVYLSDRTAAVAQPPLKLAAFAQAELAPGARRRIELTVPAREFAYWHEGRQRFEVPAGDFELSIGTSVAERPHRGLVSQSAQVLDPEAAAEAS